MTNPIVLVDLDAVADLSEWESLAKKGTWHDFFAHIPDAVVRDNMALDVLELAKADGCYVAYTCRWDIKYRREVMDWLIDNGFPSADLYMRVHADTPPAGVFFIHARAAAKKAKNRRPVIVITGDAKLAEQVSARGVSAVGIDTVPETVKGIRHALAAASKVPVAKD